MAVILITGCSSGFGHLTAARLAAKGHTVYATMRDLSQKNLLMDEYARRVGEGLQPSRLLFVRVLDVTCPETITPVVEEIIKDHGCIDVLINNAGYGIGGFFEDLTQDEIRAQFEVNFFGVQNMTRVVLPFMRQAQRGRIINLSSIAGLTASPCFSAYNASKWALEGFSEALYHEARLFGVDVMMVEPGTYKTKIFFENAKYAKRYHDPKSPYFVYSQRLKDLVVGYVCKSGKNPEDIARLIERCVESPRVKLRYISDWQSWLHVKVRRLLPAGVYGYFLRKILFHPRS